MTPEQKGISSRVLEDYLRFLNDNHIPMHNLLIARGEDTLIVAHAGVLAAMRELLLKMPREQCAHEHFPCASAIALEIGEDGAVCVAK